MSRADSPTWRLDYSLSVDARFVYLTLLLFYAIQKSRVGTDAGVIAAFHSPNHFKGECVL
jgi:hypothetical protein